MENMVGLYSVCRTMYGAFSHIYMQCCDSNEIESWNIKWSAVNPSDISRFQTVQPPLLLYWIVQINRDNLNNNFFFICITFYFLLQIISFWNRSEKCTTNKQKLGTYKIYILWWNTFIDDYESMKFKFVNRRALQ